MRTATRPGLLAAARGERRASLIEVPLARGDVSDTLYTFTRHVGNTPQPTG